MVATMLPQVSRTHRSRPAAAAAVVVVEAVAVEAAWTAARRR